VSREKVPRHILVGLEYGLITPDWGLKDYIEYAAVASDGYETIIVDGVQRSGKSNFSLQMASWAKAVTLRIELGREPTEEELWESVLKQIVFKPSDFVNTLESVPVDECMDVLVWDDINAHYTSTMFKLDVAQYSAIDATFTVIGTKCRVIISNIPNITRLAKNIKDNATFEIFIGRNKKRKMMRLFRLPGLDRIDMNLFKPDVELPSKFDIYKIPKWAWDQYEAMRKKLANEALATLKSTVNMEDLDGFIPIVDAVRLCKTSGINWGVSTLQQNISRGILVGQKVNGRLCVDENSLKEVLEVESIDYRNP